MRYADSKVIGTGKMDIPCPYCGTSRALEVIMRGTTRGPIYKAVCNCAYCRAESRWCDSPETVCTAVLEHRMRVPRTDMLVYGLLLPALGIGIIAPVFILMRVHGVI